MSCLFQSANECDGKHTDKQNYYYFQACETKMTQGGSQKIGRMRVKGAHRKKGWVRVSHWDPAQWWHWPCRWRTHTAAALPPGCGAGLRVSEQTQSINTAFLLHTTTKAPSNTAFLLQKNNCSNTAFLLQKNNNSNTAFLLHHLNKHKCINTAFLPHHKHA